INFGTIAIGADQTQTVNVSNYNLTTGVTATTAAPFSVSADGNTFGTTASIAAAGGTLYVQYAPTVVGTDNGTVTLSSTGATDVTITLAGSAIDCGNITIPFTEGFENSIECWTMISMDPANDEEFGVYADANAYDGSYDFRFSSYATATDYNQYLITPQLTLNATDNYLLRFFYQGYNSGDAFKVLYSTTNNNLSSFIELADYPTVATSWTEVVLELPSNTKYVAIDYYGNYQYYLYIDNFSITTVSSSMTLSETALDFGINEMGSISNAQYVVMSTIDVNEPFTVTTAAPFEVSLDGVNFAATQTIPANATTVVNDTIFVRFAPTAAGTFNGNLTVTSTSYIDSVALYGESIDCNSGITVPYTQNFNNQLVPPTCWSIGSDPEVFMSLGIDEAGTDFCIGMEGVDMLITPEIHATDPILVSFDYLNYGGTEATAPTYFQVGYSTTDNNPSSFTWQGENLCSTDAFANYSTVVPAGTKYVAVGASQIGTFLYYGIFEMTDIFIIDNLTLTAQTEPVLTVSPETMSFENISYGSASPAQTASVVGALLTNNITVTAPANFEVSADGTTYAATTTLPQTGGNLYVRYNPTAPGNHNGTITITGDSITTTIAVSGNAIDCSAGISSFPFLYDFNTGTYPPICWGYNNASNYGMTTVDETAGDYAMYIQGLDMLVTPEITSTQPMAVIFGYRGYVGNYNEASTSFRVGYSSTDNNVSSFTWLNTVSITDYPAGNDLFYTYSANVPANAKYIAIDVLELGYYSSYEDVIFIDNFQLLTDATMTVNPESMDFGSVIAGSTSTKTASVSAALLTSNISVTAPANFEVSANGTSYAATATLPQTGGTLYVRYNPSTVGNHNGNVTLTSGNINKTINVTGSAIDCSSAQALPFFEGFESDLTECWQNIDNDGDDYYWESSLDLDIEGYEGDGCYMSASYVNNVGALNPDNWLITPALAIPSEGAKLTWYVAAQDPDWPSEFYEVKLSTSPNISSFTSVFSETLESGDWEQRTVNIDGNWAGQTVYIAFQHHDVTNMYWMKLDNINVTAGTGVENHELNTTIFPNPANNVLNINANSNINRVEVYNMMGQMVGMYNVNDMNTQINTSNFANGVYTVRIATENGMSTQKFTVAR
ncbi:MAG: choice-of-anchor J domain-containing protein, partial [Bacteroidales bacterium]|nr:choice-of-anchor J domain-containing protein [Bacteroidales bacterium]